MAEPATFLLPSSSSSPSTYSSSDSKSSFVSSSDPTSTLDRLRHDLAPLTKYFRQIVKDTLARPIESVHRRSLRFIPPPIKEYKLDPINIKIEDLQFDFDLETIHRKFKLDMVDYYEELEKEFGTKFYVIKYRRGPKAELEEGFIEDEMAEGMMAGCLVHNKCRNACFALWPALLRLIVDDPNYLSMEQIRVHIRPCIVLFPDYMQGKEKYVPPHDVFLIHDRHGEAYIFDPTIFQFGYKEWLYKEEHYKQACMLAGSTPWSVDEIEEYDIHMEVENKTGFLERLIKWRRKLMRWPLEKLKAGEVELVDEDEDSDDSDEIGDSDNSEDSGYSEEKEEEQDGKSEENGEITDEDGNDADDEAESGCDSFFFDSSSPLSASPTSQHSSSFSSSSSSFSKFVRFIEENDVSGSELTKE